MSRGFPLQSDARAGTRFWVIWAVVLIAATALFLKFHPSRPPFSVSAEDGTGPDVSGGLRAVLGAAIVLALAWASGGALFRRTPSQAPVSLTAWLVAGMVLIAHLSWLLATFGILRWYVLAPLALLPLVFRRPDRALVRVRLRVNRVNTETLLFAVPVALVFLLVLLRSLAPATANDAMVYHFEIARRVAGSGTHMLPAESIYGRMPHLGALGYASAWLFGGEGAALLLRVAALTGVALTAARLGRMVAPDALNGLMPVAFLLVCAHPILLDPRTFGNVDLFSALLFLLAAEQILGRENGGPRQKEGRTKTALLPAGFFAGAFLAIKLSNVFLMPVLAALFWTPAISRARAAGADGNRASAPAPFGAVAGFLVLAAIPVIPWIVRNAITSGHPFFPVVPGSDPVWDAALADRLQNWQLSMGMGRAPLDFLLLPFRLFFEGDRGYARFDGTLHPVLLLALIPAALLGGLRARGAIAAGVAGIWLWALGPQQARFFLPVLVFLAAGCGWDWLPARGSKMRYAIIAMLVLSTSAGLFRPAVDLARDTIPVVAGTESRESYRARHVQSYEALKNITRQVPPGETVLFLWENRLYGFDRPHIADSFFEASQIARLAERDGSSQAFGARMAERGVRWVAVNRSLERVFGRQYARETMVVLNGYVAGLEPVGAWKGIELYRVPAPPPGGAPGAAPGAIR